jgi:nascent polypeptide-associated complex subunit alpha
MMPGFGGMDPKKMQAMMKQLGIQQNEIDATRVIIEKSDGGKLVVENPQVSKVTMQGQETLQVMGEISEESGEAFSEEDVKLVMEKSGKGEEEVRKVLEGTNGDIAEAIVKLNGASA